MGFSEPAGTDPHTPQLQPPLRPPADTVDSGESSVGAYRWLWIALTIAVLLSLAVIFLLPKLVPGDATSTPPERPPAQGQIHTPPAVVEDIDSTQRQAEQTLQQFLRLQAILELENAEVWGEPAWSQAAIRVASGDRLFGERRFADATLAYSDALQKLQELQGKRKRFLDAALDLGLRALRNDNAQAAIIQFERALAIEPDHQLASHSLDRARVRDRVLEHMAAGKSADSKGDIEAARAAYLAAGLLDGEYLPASENLLRVSAQLTEHHFRAAMSQALSALDSGQLDDAAKALSEAARLKPGNGAVGDARLRLTAARQQAQLSSLRRQALKAIEKENWQSAASLYREALAVDASAAFARTGLTRVRDRLRLHEQLDHYLNDPTRLASTEPLANAEKLLSTAGEAPDSEPRLAEKIRLLNRRVAEARMPLPVRLYSDGETEVVIYHVGRFGRFHDHQLELRPGTYTAVGTRAGYRDVRRVFTVSPGQPPPPVDIRCEEPV